jgi:phosphohistidine phosphatase
MKKIIFIRHGKSGWDSPWLSDHDRPLAERGIIDVPHMALRLQKRGLVPDLIVSSTALRAADTARLTAAVFGYPESAIVLEKSLYHASPELLLEVIRSQSEAVQTLVLVGHNPGLTELIQELGCRLDNLPTAGQYGCTLSDTLWVDFASEKISTEWIDYPKKLG